MPPADSARPLLAITLGDPAGVGPEVVAGCWNQPAIHQVARLVVIGHPTWLERAVELRFPRENRPKIELTGPEELSTCESAPGRLPCLLPSAEPELERAMQDSLEMPVRTVDPRGGEAAYQAVLAAARLAKVGQIDGLVTAPLSKAALHAAGHRYPGHTELLAELCGVSDFAMMLYLPPGVAGVGSAGLGVAHVTLHTALRNVFEQLTPAAIASKCDLAHEVARRLGAAQPRVGVAALNPHAGEGGLFGNEESTVIAPGIALAQSRGVLASGPYPADTLLLRASRGEFDSVVAMYHDQGHIALKLLAMHAAVNITLGLPIVRTSVAHGTALDLAWTGIAETSGMAAAITTAAHLATNRC